MILRILPAQNFSENGHTANGHFVKNLKGSPDPAWVTQAILFLKSMSGRVGSDIERL